MRSNIERTWVVASTVSKVFKLWKPEIKKTEIEADLQCLGSVAIPTPLMALKATLTGTNKKIHS